jgi:FixJ family two-component response regulator
MKVDAVAPLIAVVDGNEAVRTAVANLTRSAAYRSVMFESGKEFLESDIKQEISCLILDLDTPGLSGLKLHRRLAQTGGLVPPTVFLSGDEGELRARALRLGAVAVLGRTCDTEVLVSAITSAVRLAGW